jgi:hypothetical protein
MKPLLLTAALALAALFGCAAQAQTYQDSGGTIVPGFVPIQPGVGPLGTASNPMKVSGSFSASLSGFQPSSSGSVGTQISAQATVATGSTQSLPIGTVVIASNVGATNVAYCQLGSTASTSSQPIAPNGGWFAFTVGSATQLSCVTSTSTTTVNTLGGSGLPTGAVGGSGGSSSLASLGPVAPGTVAANSDLIGGVYNSGGIIVASGQQAALQLDPVGRLYVDAPIGQGPTGSAVPAQAIQVGANSGGNLTGIIQANAQAAINISTATTTTLVSLVSGKAIYVTGWDVLAAGAGNLTLEYGMGSNCATGTTAITGNYNFTAQSGITRGGNLGVVFTIPASNALCALTSAAVQMSGSVSYTQF